jgi:hypothetical protein
MGGTAAVAFAAYVGKELIVDPANDAKKEAKRQRDKADIEQKKLESDLAARTEKTKLETARDAARNVQRTAQAGVEGRRSTILTDNTIGAAGGYAGGGTKTLLGT